MDLTSLPAHTLFEQACARCHGPGGSLLPRKLHAPPDQLPGVVAEMMTGPAQLDPTTQQVEQMIEFVRAVIASRGGP